MGQNDLGQIGGNKLMKICCGKLEQLIAEGYGHPFSCENGVWKIWLTKKKKSGNHNDKDYKKVIMTFCPFCGANLEQKRCEGD